MSQSKTSSFFLLMTKYFVFRVASSQVTSDSWVNPVKISYSAIKKNTFESVLMRWMKLEPIIQSEVSQKEKHQYSILTHIYGI